MARDDNQFKSDRIRRWMVAACCCFCNFTFYGISRMSGLMLVAATQTFHVTRARAAVPFSLSTALRNLAGVFVGHLGHRFGVGAVVAVGCLIASLGSALCFFANNVEWLTYCWGGLFGLGFGLSTCLLPLAINQNFTKHSGTASGISYSGSYIGSFIFPPILVKLLDIYGLQGTFLIISGGILNVFVAAMILRERKSKKKDAKLIISKNNSEGNYTKNSTYFKQIALETDNSGNIRDDSTAKWQNVIIDSRKDRISVALIFCPSKNFDTIKRPLQDGSVLKTFDNYLTPSNHQIIGTKNLQSELCVRPSVVKCTQGVVPGSFPTVNDDVNLRNKFNRRYQENGNADLMKGSGKDVLMVPKSYFKKLNFSLKYLSKGKLKSKYKLRIRMLKKHVLASLMERSHCFRKNLPQPESVQLLSFRYLLPSSYNYAVNIPISNKHASLTLPMNNFCVTKSIGGVKTQGFRFAKRFDKCSFELDKNAKDADNIYPNGRHRIIDETLCFHSLELLCKPVQCNENLVHPSMDTKSLDVLAKDIYKSSFLNAERKLSCNHLRTSCNKRDTDIVSINSVPTIYNSDDKTTSPCFFPNFLQQVKEQEVELKPSNLNLFQEYSSVAVVKRKKKCLPDWVVMFCEPMFVIISLTMSIQTFIVVCIVTTIEDFAKDIEISKDRTHYALMALSTANLVGTLTLGAITDRGFMSRQRFLSFCFLGMSVSLVAISLFAVSLSSLLVLVSLYGLLESGVIIMFPLLTRQFVHGERKQAVAIASSNALSAPTVMLVPMLIGHFRDHIGCYSGLFHLLGATSFTCSIIWLMAPSIVQRGITKKNIPHQIVENC